MKDMNLMKCSSVRSILLSVILCIIRLATAELPQELDPFLEKLFATEACEGFISDASFLSVGTRDCAPYTCEFPHQLCMRPAASYGDEKANQCRDLPLTCVTAANGGVPVPRGSRPVLGGSKLNGPNQTTNVDPDEMIGLEFVGEKGNRADRLGTSSGVDTSRLQSRPQGLTGSTSASGRRQNFGPICEQGVPEGRFCGFELKYAFNHETRRCEQFWYPGCTTENTNDNLFGSLEKCQTATNHCGMTNGKIFEVEELERRPVDNGIHRRGGSHGHQIGGGNNGPAATKIGQINGGGADLHGSNNIPEQLISIGRSFAGKGDATGDGGMPSGGPASVVSTFSRLLTGSALGGMGQGQGGQSGAVRGQTGSEYGGGALGTGGGDGSGVTQPPNFIRLIANTIREVGNAQQGKAASGSGDGVAAAGKGARGTASEILNRFDAGQIASIFQSL